MKRYRHVEEKKERVKVVIDTNIFISAFISRQGLPANIFELLIYKKIINFISPAILLELYDVFNRDKFKKHIYEFEKEFYIESIISNSIPVYPSVKINIIKEDHKDNKFLECAKEADVDYIISGDEHLLKLKKFRNIKIVSAKEFITLSV